MCSDKNDALLAIFSGEFSVSDDAWTLDAVRWGFVEKKKIIASLKGKMGSGPFTQRSSYYGGKNSVTISAEVKLPMIIIARNIKPIASQ